MGKVILLTPNLAVYVSNVTCYLLESCVPQAIRDWIVTSNRTISD